MDYEQLNTHDDPRESKKSGRKGMKKSPKKDVVIKEISKQSRQLHVMDIARVNSIFPNDILALMPCSQKKGEKEKIKIQKASVGVQTEDMPLIKVYDVCKFNELS